MPPYHSTRRHYFGHARFDENLIVLAHPRYWDCFLDLAPHSSSSLRSTSSAASATLAVDRHSRADVVVDVVADRGAREVARDGKGSSVVFVTEVGEEGEACCWRMPGAGNGVVGKTRKSAEAVVGTGHLPGREAQKAEGMRLLVVPQVLEEQAGAEKGDNTGDKRSLLTTGVQDKCARPVEPSSAHQ